MAAVIDTLLAAARSTTVPGSSDAVAAAHAVARLVRPSAEAHDRRLVVRAAAVPLAVGTAEEVVAGALHPLLENAVRHAAHDVEIRLTRENGHIVIAVIDDGDGISPDDADRIFEPGVSDAGGAGLGLPLARRLARAAGGDVVAVPQDGGRVELRLPA
jgi:signal transduction histidine kinase